MSIPKTQLIVLNSSTASVSVSSSEKTWIFPKITPAVGTIFRASLQVFRMMHVFRNLPSGATFEIGLSSNSTQLIVVPPGNYTPTGLGQLITQYMQFQGIAGTVVYDGNNLVYTFGPSGLYIGPGTTNLRQLGVLAAGQYTKSTVPVNLDDLTAFQINLTSNSIAGIMGFIPFDTRYGFRYEYQSGNDGGFGYFTGLLSYITIQVCDQDNISLANKYIVDPPDEASRLNYIPEWHVAILLEEVPISKVTEGCAGSSGTIPSIPC
jgi:hypothetical protein